MTAFSVVAIRHLPLASGGLAAEPHGSGAATGASIIVHGRNTERGQQVVKEIEAAGGQARFLAADLTDPAQITRLAEQAGEVDILVNNAGRSWFGPTAELDVRT